MHLPHKRTLFLSLAAAVLLALGVWRLRPLPLSALLTVDPAQVTSLACSANVAGVLDGEALIDTYALPTLFPEDEAFSAVLDLLTSTGYRRDFRDLLPWPLESVSSGRNYGGRTVNMVLVWGSGAEENCALSMYDRQVVLFPPGDGGFLIYHPADPAVFHRLVDYLCAHGQKS